MLAVLDVSSPLPAGAVAAAAVRSLHLRDFRNYGRLRVELGTGIIVLTGANGAGKTNLLEAVSLLAPGRGLRRARLSELDRHGGGPWSVACVLETRGERLTVATGRAPDSERRRVEVEGTGRRGATELAFLASVLWLTPTQDRIFQEAPAARRRFLDRLVMGIDPDHGRRLAAYERSLRERSHVLRQPRPDGVWLRALESRAAELGVAIAAARRDFAQAVGPLLACERSPFPSAAIAINGEVEGWLAEMPALAAEERLQAALRAARPTDLQQASAGHGPHRTDLLVLDGTSGTPARDCSTGRQKALLLSIVLAEARLLAQRTGELPILLLDEVAAHLDRRRRCELLETLLDLRAQVWLTGTDPALFAALATRAEHLPFAARPRHYDVNDGSLSLL